MLQQGCHRYERWRPAGDENVFFEFSLSSLGFSVITLCFFVHAPSLVYLWTTPQQRKGSHYLCTRQKRRPRSEARRSRLTGSLEGGLGMVVHRLQDTTATPPAAGASDIESK